MNKTKLFFLSAFLFMVQSYTLADDRITIFEESFATGFGDFIVETDESPDASKGHWEHSNEGFVYISGLNSKDWTNGVSKLMSPVIDLGLYHDAILTFEYNVSQSTYNRMYTKVLIKEEDGEWESIMEGGWMETYGLFSLSCKLHLARYNGKKIRICISADPWIKGAIGDLKIRNFKIDGMDGVVSNLPVKVNTIKELQSLPVGTFAEIHLNSALVSMNWYEIITISDETGGIMIPNRVNGSGQKICELSAKLRFTGTVTGVRTADFALNEISDARFSDDTKIIYPDDMMDGNRYSTPAEISENQLEDYDCQVIRMGVKDPELQFYYLGADFSEPDAIYHYSNYKDVIGVACLTPEHEKRVIYIDLYNFLSDEDEYIYNPEIGIDYIKRSFQKDKWCTLCLPFEINSKHRNSEVFNKATIAVYSSHTEDNINFRKVDLSQESIEAGTPFLIKPFYDRERINTYPQVTMFTFEDVSGQTRINAGNYNFVGTLAPIQPHYGTLYLSANNTLRPLAEGGTIKAYRAYFEPVGASPAQAKAMRFTVDGEDQGSVTGIDGLIIAPKPVNENVYNMSGQYVGNSLDEMPQGVYIVNGKKIVK